MSQRVEGPPEFAGTLFDVTIMLPEGKRTADIDPMSLQAAGIPAQHLDHLIRLLGAGQPAKVKGAVPWARATQIGERFGRTGVNVAISRSLSIRTLASDGLETCPACDVRVKMPANRQCPACKVFVDRMSPEFQEQRKLADSVRAVREAEEASTSALKAEKQRVESLIGEYHASIHRELGPTYRLVRRQGLLEGPTRQMIAAATLILLAAVFAAGYGVSAHLVHGPKPEPGVPESPAVAAINQLLEQLNLKQRHSEPVGGPLVTTPVESLLRGADGSRLTLRSLALERAIEVALADKGQGGRDTVDAARGDKPAMPSITVPMQAKLLLAAGFARSLAEMGQAARAQDIVKALKDAPELALDAVAAGAVRLADLEVQAWSMQSLAEPRARHAAALLRQAAAAIADPAERAVASSRVGAITAGHGQLPADISRSFLASGVEAARAVADARVRPAALGEWAVATADVHAADATHAAKSGMRTQARAAADQVEKLVKQAPDEASRARLQAIDYRLRQQLGEAERANASIEAALARVARIEKLADRAGALRAIAQLAGPTAAERVASAANLIATAAGAGPATDASPGSGAVLERARARMLLALTYTDMGQPGQAERLGQLALTTAGLNPGEAVTLLAEFTVQRDISAAKTMQAQERYAEAEVLLQRIAGYLR
jgi:hypothetical protein